MQLDQTSTGGARRIIARTHYLARKAAAPILAQNRHAPQQVCLRCLNALIKLARRRLGRLGRCRALQLLGEHAGAAGDLAINVERHMNAPGIVIDLIDLFS